MSVSNAVAVSGCGCATRDHACCSTPAAPAKRDDACCVTTTASIKPTAQAHHAQHGAHAARTSSARLASAATLHCLTGCAIGELVGLMIGVSLGLPAMAVVGLATVGGFTSGYLLGLWPLVKRGMSWGNAFRAIWLGETISIAIMELVMNLVDYHVGGAGSASILSARFWIGYGFALPAGYLAAWPVNWWLLKRNIKAPCH